MIDGTVKENITLSENTKRDSDSHLSSIIKLTQLEKTINTFPNSLDTNVGERGSRLSGGEIQRIGIARALYKDKNLIVFDEATSALDNLIEAKVIDGINKLPETYTIIMIAHRLSSLSYCDKIVMVENGKTSILESGTQAFQDIISKLSLIHI